MRRLLMLAAVAILVTGCDMQGNNVQIEKRAVDDQQNLYVRTQPVPYFEYSLERDVLIQLYRARNEARLTHTVVTSQGTGTPLWDCPSIGFPIPADTQLTNPVKDVGNGGTIMQPEPNGLYTSPNTDATWVLCATDDGKAEPLYTEQKANAFTFPVVVDYTTGKITRGTGESSFTVDVITQAASPSP